MRARVKIGQVAVGLVVTLALLVATPASGMVGAGAARLPDGPQRSGLRLLGSDLHIRGRHDVSEWVDFAYSPGPDRQVLHPARVYGYEDATRWEVGRNARPLGEGTSWSEMFGDGGDGDLTVNAGQTFYVDSVRTGLSATSSAGQRNLYVVSTSGFSVGDEVLVIQMRGAGSGNYEFGIIASVALGQVALEDDLEQTYTAGGDCQGQVLRVPHYQSVTVQGTLTAHTWDGATGGVVVFRASGEVLVGLGGAISVVGRGYRGGSGGYSSADSSTRHGYQGEGRFGVGTQSALSSDAGGGGGRADTHTNDGGGGGGGGSHQSIGHDGEIDPIHPHQGYGLGAVAIYGRSDLSMVTMGGGGGGGATDDAADSQGGAGGGGGGILLIFSGGILVTGQVTASGEDGHNGAGGGQGGGGAGGGAGGSIRIVAGQAVVGSSLVRATGGARGVTNSQGGNGGAGGSGRIRIEYCESLSGTTDPPASIRHLDCHSPSYIYLPGVFRGYPANPYEEDDTPGDATGPLANGVWYYAYANDQDDYYYFTLASQAAVTVRVADFTATQGHLMVLDSGLGLVTHTTNQGHPSSMELTMQLGPGTYYVRVYAQGNLNTQTLYGLQVAWSP